MTRYPLYFTPGDDETRVFKYLDSTGAVVNISGYTAQFIGTVNNATVTLSATVDGVNGKVTVAVPDTNTTSLGAAGPLGHYFVTVTSPGSVTTTIAAGPLVMLVYP